MVKSKSRGAILACFGVSSLDWKHYYCRIPSLVSCSRATLALMGSKASRTTISCPCFDRTSFINSLAAGGGSVPGLRLEQYKDIAPMGTCRPPPGLDHTRQACRLG